MVNGKVSVIDNSLKFALLNNSYGVDRSLNRSRNNDNTMPNINKK
jgi:hypothetical protein